MENAQKVHTHMSDNGTPSSFAYLLRCYKYEIKVKRSYLVVIESDLYDSKYILVVRRQILYNFNIDKQI